jgi:hypothetical protein
MKDIAAAVDQTVESCAMKDDQESLPGCVTFWSQSIPTLDIVYCSFIRIPPQGIGYLLEV